MTTATRTLSGCGTVAAQMAANAFSAAHRGRGAFELSGLTENRQPSTEPSTTGALAPTCEKVQAPFTTFQYDQNR